MENTGDPQLPVAAKDIRYLLEKGYPKTGAIRFVSDHYRLSSEQRHILTRTVIKPEIARLRRKKRISCENITGRTLAIDGYNVLIAIEGALGNYPLWISDDGFVRDTMGKFRNFKMTESTNRAIEKLMGFLSVHSPSEVTVMLDRPISNSGKLAALIREKMKAYGIEGDVETADNVDYCLKAGNTDIVATSDGIIIDAVDLVTDIPACIAGSLGVPLYSIDATSG
jgi:hypothetical protein